MVNHEKRRMPCLSSRTRMTGSFSSLAMALLMRVASATGVPAPLTSGVGRQYTDHQCRRYLEVPDHADGNS